MSLTLETAQAHLDAWLAADLAVAEGQSYNIGDRSLTRADSAEISNKINYWSRLVNDFTRVKSGKSRHGISIARFR